MVACCIPCKLTTPALRSSVLNSFISPLLFRVHAADSYEHHAVLSVASAMSNAATGSTHFFFSWGGWLDEAAIYRSGLPAVRVTVFRSCVEEFVYSIQRRKMQWTARPLGCQ